MASDTVIGGVLQTMREADPAVKYEGDMEEPHPPLVGKTRGRL